MAKIALLIGISDYQPGFDPLPGTQTDIREMQRVLEHPQMGGFDEVDVLANPDNSAMQLAIEKLLADRQRDDLVLLYFSGHGFKDDDGSLYFVTRTTEQRSAHQIYQSTAVPARVVQDWMSRSRCKRQVLVLDCCFSGAFAEGMKAKAVNETVDINAQFGGEGRAVLTSSTALQYSFEQQDASIYTRYLVEGIENGAADTDSNGVITIDELHDYAKRKVQEAAPAMKPEIFAVKEGYTIVLAKAPLGDPKVEYRKEVERLAQQRNGQLSSIILRALNERRKRLKLSPEVAEAIQSEVLQPFRDFEAKQQQYEQAFRDEIQKEFPLSAAIRADLQYFQQVLGLRDEDIAAIEARVNPQSIAVQPVSAPDETGMIAEDFYNRGLEKGDAKDFQGAIADLDQAIKLNPDYADAYMGRAAARFVSGDTPGAVQDCDQAIKLNPDYADAYMVRASVRFASGDNQGAIQDYDQVIALQPDNADAYMARVSARVASGDNEGAIQECDQVIALQPDYAPAYYNRGLIRCELGDQQTAIQDYNQAVTLDSDFTDAYYNRGQAHTILGNQQAAIQDYSQVITLNPDYSADAYYNRGNARAALGDKQSAIEDYQQAAKLYQQQGKTKDYQDALDRIKALQK